MGKNSLPLGMVHILTNSKQPSSCSVEGNIVSSFDNTIYPYTFNNCEHVIFKDCTDSPKVMVSAKKISDEQLDMHIVKVVIDGNKYEIEMLKATKESIFWTWCQG